MTLTVIACLCLIFAVWLWHNAFKYTVDAAPVGSMMLVVSIVFGVASVFLFGVQIGTML